MFFERERGKQCEREGGVCGRNVIIKYKLVHDKARTQTRTKFSTLQKRVDCIQRKILSGVRDGFCGQPRDGTGQDFLDPTRPVNFKMIAG